MARASKVATKPKKKTVRAVRRGANMMPLMPSKNLNWDRAKYYTHYEVESKEWLSTVKAYIKKHYDKKILTNINKLPDWKVGGKSHWTCAAYLLDNNPELVPTIYKEGIHKWILELAEEGAALVKEEKAEEKAKPKNVHVPTIQERITEQAQEACEAIEEWLDGFITDKKNFDPKGFDFVSHFANKKVSQAHARKIKGYYASELEEALLIQKLPTPGEINREKDEHKADMLQQLREGYSHLTKKDAATYLTALETLCGACDMVIDASKATRKPRVKKPVAKEKLVAKVQYKDRDDKLQIVSVNPLDLIESTEVWVYNVKTRKLGKYVAEEGQHMQVKGTSLLFYDADKSLQKTLRKPEETLKEFKKAGKVKLRTFMEDIKTTDIKLNGRLNSDTIILKCS
jgi:hypothetical protein